MVKFIENLKEKILKFTRFKGAMVGSILLFILSIYSIYDVISFTSDVLGYMAASICFAIVFSILAAVILEFLSIEETPLANLVETCVFVLSLLTYFAWSADSVNLNYILSFLMSAAVIVAFFLTTGEDFSEGFSKFISNNIFTGFVCGITYGGLALCLAAIDGLGLANVEWEVFATLGSFIGCIFAINLCLTGVPNINDYETSGKFWRIFMQNVCFPIYLILVTILYVYFIKIIFTLSIPAGQINRFATLAAAFYIFFYYALKQYESSSSIRNFIKLGGIVMLPILLLQLWAIAIRVASYGWTSGMYISIMWNIFAIIFAILSIIKRAEYIKFASLISIIFIGILSLPTPINAVRFPANSQLKNLEKIIEKYDLIENGKVVEKEMSTEDKSNLISAYNYLRYKQRTEWPERPEYLDNWEISSSSNASGAETSKSYYYYSNLTDFDTFGYTKVIIANSNDIKPFEDYGLNADEYFNELKAQYGDHAENVSLIKETENCKFIFSSFSIYVNDGEIVKKYATGYILIKEAVE